MRVAVCLGWVRMQRLGWSTELSRDWVLAHCVARYVCSQLLLDQVLALRMVQSVYGTKRKLIWQTSGRFCKRMTSATRLLKTSRPTCGNRCDMSKNIQHTHKSMAQRTLNGESRRHIVLLRYSLFVEILFSAASFFGIVGTGAILFGTVISRSQAVPIEISGSWLVVLSLVCLGPLFFLRKHINRLIADIERPMATGSRVSERGDSAYRTDEDPDRFADKNIWTDQG